MCFKRICCPSCSLKTEYQKTKIHLASLTDILEPISCFQLTSNGSYVLNKRFKNLFTLPLISKVFLVAQSQ